MNSVPRAGAMVLRYYMVYIVLDASLSMRIDLRTGEVDPEDLRNTPLGQFTGLLVPMLFQLAENPVVNSLISVGVVAFNDRAEALRDMSTLTRPSVIRSPSRGRSTDYAAVLRHLVDHHGPDAARVRQERKRPEAVITTARPWVFFVTDGRPYANGRDQNIDEWMPHREALTGGDIKARIVTIGLRGAHEDTLWRLATGGDGPTRNAFIARQDADPAALSSSVVKAIRHSITRSLSSGGSGTVLFEVPEGMRRIDGGRRD
ncbi:VWA domain-containing protein [Dactylosporangium vinaceum]|uniref:VWFA domain-containing protein n=1 Tax=Dactylosporangium vinaceum TaxID=53362 RepID=A0ABV5M0C6_9ACTN|nr:vWA domain-containing protein [Dactylosporangium vinaceum]UAB97408.1 VWA domain-containing protein [Dactylosporangium vinaceum]